MKKAVSFVASVATLLAVSLSPFAPSASAHCPQTPFDTTVFAPIADESGFALSLELVASGLTAPMKGTTASGHPSRLFVVDQPGILWAVNLNAGSKTTFLDVSGRLVTLGVLGPDTFDERGFLGVAFHPGYLSNGLLYTYTSEPNAGPPTFPTTLPAGSTADHQNVLAEWHVNNPSSSSSTVDIGSRRELLRVDWPQFNHNGGDLAFGPDGQLYISMGDGGGADDADGQLFVKATGTPDAPDVPIIGHQGDGNAQKLNTPLGKILRIDVNGRNSANGQYGVPFDNPFVQQSGAVAEIYAFGFRNPWRFSFDGANLYEGDVGQNDIEEVNLVVRGGNFGWNRKEGTLFFHINGNLEGFASRTPPVGVVVPPNVVDPIAQYDIHHEGHSVIGGFVYHGRRFPQLHGRYVFGEFSRVFNFPSGPHNYGRLLYIQQQHSGRELRTIREFKGFSDAIAALGLDVGDPACEGLLPPTVFPPTLAVLGMGQDAAGEVYAMGNISGVPFGTEGVVLRIVPKRGN
jgi:glucose/arabinose dehydrogenase